MSLVRLLFVCLFLLLPVTIGCGPGRLSQDDADAAANEADDAGMETPEGEEGGDSEDDGEETE